MKVLLATTEIEALTGATPLGLAVGRLARSLHASADSDVIVALPSTDAILEAHAGALHDTGAVIAAASGREEGPTARVLEFRSDGGPQIYLIDSTELRHGFGETQPAESLAARALLFARFLANLSARLKPRIHIAHCFGWESALLPPLIHTGDLDLKTILTTTPRRGDGPAIAAFKEAVTRSGLSALAAIVEEPDSRPFLAWAGRFADKTGTLGDAARPDAVPREPILAAPSMAIRAKQTARASTLALHDLTENALSTLFYVPTDNPAPLLPFLDRLLDADARVIVEGRPEDPAAEAALLTTQMRHPGKLAFVKIESFLADEQDWFTAADFLLLLPRDADDPDSVASVALALRRGCTPVIPRRDHFRPAINGPPAADPARPATVFYRNESPEAVWSALKHCMRLHRDPALWKEQVGNVVRTGLADGGIAPEFAALYREVIESSLASSR